MKKSILSLAFVLGLVCALNAQSKGNDALGIRLSILTQEISYQHSFSDANRMELSFGYGAFGQNAEGSISRGVALNGVYQWVNDLSKLAPGFMWFYGVGGAVLLHDSHFGVGILGQIGIDYNFSFPLQLALDYRPGLYLVTGTDKVARISLNLPCIAVRYKF